MRLNFSRLLVTLLIMIVVQYAAGYLLAMLNIYGLVSAVIVDFVVAFVLVLFYTPSQFRKYAIKTTQFHYNVLSYFIILLIFTLIQYFL